MTTTTLPTVDTEMLDTVTGGFVSNGGTYNSNSQLQQLQSLLNSLNKSTNNCNGEFGPLAMMMFAMMIRNNEGPRVVYARPACWY